MKLLTHNFLASKFLKGVTTGYPLKVVPSSVEVKEQFFNPEFLKKMIKKIDYEALKAAAAQVGHSEGLPETLPDNLTEESAECSTSDTSDELLKTVHRVLLEVEVTEGHLECPESGRQFPIRNGIPNMLANEDEVE